MKSQEKKRKNKTEERMGRFEWLMFLGEIILFIPRLFGRLIRWIVDLF